MNSREIVVVAVISWILFIGCSNSQGPGCSPGWFGSDCQYKCRCTSGYCNKDGLCIRGAKCLGGWFGPACQYADLAYDGFRQLTDGDDSTCIFLQNDERIVISLAYTIPFSWMRIYVSRPDYLHNLTVAFHDDLGCTNQRTATVDDNTLDIYCDLTKHVQLVNLTGAGVRYLCSVYISGGRNIALKQKTNQTTTWRSYGSQRAVDGDNNIGFGQGSCSVTVTKPPSNPWWSVTFSRPSHVNRYVVFTRKGLEQRLQGFTLESFDVNSRVVDYFNNTTNPTHPVYNVTYANMRSPISSVLIRNTNRENIVELCEVEIYGETACEPGRYGRECNKTCNCAGGQPCFISTGGCPSGCATGFYGESCDLPCVPGLYGLRCSYRCGDYCVKNTSDERPCDHVTGACLRGCEKGYQKPTCAAQCVPGLYGLRCSYRCSDYCVKNTSDERPCDHVTGACLRGCEKGYQKPTCAAPCQRGRYGQDCSSTCSQFCVDTNITTDSVCDHITGVCAFGCHSDHQASFCGRKDPDHGDVTAAVVGSVAGAIVVALVALAVALAAIRKRRRTKSEIEQVHFQEINKENASLNESATHLYEEAFNTPRTVSSATQTEEPVNSQSTWCSAIEGVCEEPLRVNSTDSIAQQHVYGNIPSTTNSAKRSVHEDPLKVQSIASSAKQNVYDNPENTESTANSAELSYYEKVVNV